MKRLLLFFLTAVSLPIFAQDLRGAYIRSSWVSGLTYSVSVTLLTDASMNLARPTVSVNFGDGNTGALALNNSSSSNGVSLKHYSGSHIYAGTGSYIVSCTDTFRVAGITNMSSSQTQSLYVESRIYSAGTRTPNSAPVISIQPIINGAVGNPIQYNPGFTDNDGDSLSYLLSNCSGANYTLPGGATLNNTSGLFSFSAASPGLYAFTFLIYEWRNSPAILVGTSQLDFVVDIASNVGITEAAASPAKASVYPNPVSGELHISSNQLNDRACSLELFNCLGQRVLKTSYRDQLDVSDLPKGLYFLRLSGSGSELSTTFIKD